MEEKVVKPRINLASETVKYLQLISTGKIPATNRLGTS